ncbi:response regulator transcription factor [Subsaximicrobium wynnwilliamsii]|uniref:response regulator transcription factor n=1 Tax=Subsaximicrobium wynnwilliamsii TaxID=291179 RepID=UPI00167A597B|nr:response regulator transcription factor [Subsaximicrobium wynnwilliamsii]
MFLDLSLPVSKDKKFLSGDDIGLWLREKSPETKILIFTFISDSERIRSIIKTIKPDGFINKSDFEPSNLSNVVKTILAGGSHYSQIIKNHETDQIVDRYITDEMDRKIVYHLSMGEKTKDLPALVHLSLRSIEERKVKLRDLFGITKDSDSNLIKEAKKRHII